MDKKDAKERAKLIIAEIIRQAGGELHNKTNLYKAFYHAHLIYAQSQPGYLSTWPIVKMPNGPGIHNGDRLLGELIAEGILSVEEIPVWQYSAFKFELVDPSAIEGKLEPEAVAAIEEAMKTVLGRSAAEVSEESHAQSRTWRDAKLGQELVIYADTVPEAEYQERKRAVEVLVETMRGIRASAG